MSRSLSFSQEILEKRTQKTEKLTSLFMEKICSSCIDFFLLPDPMIKTLRQYDQLNTPYSYIRTCCQSQRSQGFGIYQIWLKFRNSISNNVVGSFRLIISQIFNIGAWLFLFNLIPLSLRIVRFPICKKIQLWFVSMKKILFKKSNNKETNKRIEQKCNDKSLP